jgi:hypothetical protein
MAVQAIPTMMDAANKKMVRRNMIAVLSAIAEKRIPLLAGMILEQVALGSRNLAPSVIPCVIASLIYINSHSGTGCITTLHQTRMRSFDHERNDQSGRDLPSKGAFVFRIGCCVQPRGIFYGADRIRG